ncbi:MAG: aldehyde dehydrogenase [Chitinophagaceae bacterium]
MIKLATVAETSIRLPDLLSMRYYFESGGTRPYSFRKQQLLALKQAVLKHEAEINAALYADLGKSPEESYVTETGLFLTEINTCLANLKSWMRPRSASTNLVNLPSTSKIYRDPLGVVLIIAPWNYPLQLLLIPLIGAIAGGNAAVLKPSELAPATAAVAEKIITACFPPQYITVIQGDGAVVIPEMMRSFRFDHVFYTGSIAVGRSIYQLAAADLVPVTLELGGKSPAIVEADADLAIAARRIAVGKFLNAGQTCIAPDYILVQNQVKEKFLSLLKETITGFYSEDPSGSSDYGKIINEKRFNTLVSYLDQGNVIYGGRYNRAALYFAPTIMDDVSLDAPVMTEEIFGPILPLVGFSTREEALSIVQRNPNPLAFYLFTNNKEAEKEWILKLAFGGGCVNNTDWHFVNHHLPFGGVGSSGMGAYHGKFTFETFTRLKSVLKSPLWFDPSVKYPPFKGRLKLFRWLIR